MKRSPIVVVALVVGAAHAAGPAEIGLVRGGKAYELSEAARARIGEELPKLFATCSLNSRDHPQIFASSDAGTVWQDTHTKDRLTLRFAIPTNVGHPHQAGISALQLVLRLDDARFPGPQLSRNGNDVIIHSKCSGGDMIKFVCAPEIKPLMPGSYAQLCRVLRQ
jgi:hypothetical protein